MRIGARTSLLAAVFWILLGVMSMTTSIGRIHDLKAIGQPVHPLRYASLGFWVIVLAFWIVLGWKSWKRLRAERKVV